MFRGFSQPQPTYEKVTARGASESRFRTNLRKPAQGHPFEQLAEWKMYAQPPFYILLQLHGGQRAEAQRSEQPVRI